MVVVASSCCSTTTSDRNLIVLRQSRCTELLPCVPRQGFVRSTPFFRIANRGTQQRVVCLIDEGPVSVLV